MPLNKQSGNMYGWVNYTWNPLAGSCPHRCDYCSTHSLKKRNKVLDEKYSGEPRVYEKELSTNLGEGNTIFVCNMVDLFADGVPNKAIKRILGYLNEYPDNRYLLQSKNPKRMLEYTPLFPPDVILATTIESNLIYPGTNAPSPWERMRYITELKKRGYTVEVTIEPVMRFDWRFKSMIRHIQPDFVAIGADSKNNNLPEPVWSAVKELIEYLEEFTEVRRKSNLDRLKEENDG